jgi:chloramphenicol 3-O phosphotransferase
MSIPAASRGSIVDRNPFLYRHSPLISTSASRYGVEMTLTGHASGVRRPLVILLSGASSSGKTSLARALQRRLADPAVLVEADRAFPAVPSEHPRWVVIGQSRDDVALAFHRSVAVWPQLGFDVIVDGSLPYEDRQLRDRCMQVFAPFDLRIIGVRCSDPELTDREVSRSEERPTGWAIRQAKDIHEGMPYAAEVDTTARSPEACADDAANQLGLSLLRRHAAAPEPSLGEDGAPD